MKRWFDSVIIGSGPAAAAAAIGLARRGHSVVILIRADRRDLPSFGEHLAPQAQGRLAELELEGVLVDQKHQVSRRVVSCWGSGTPLSRDYVFCPFGSGLNLDRRSFDRSLFDKVRQIGVTVVTIQRVQFVEHVPRGLKVTAERAHASEEIFGSFLIDATGRAATLARRFGSQICRVDTLVGLYARLASSQSEDNALLLEPTYGGWWYSVPVFGDETVVVYMTDGDLFPKHQRARQRFWQDRLNEATETRRRVVMPSAPFSLYTAVASSQRLSCHGGAKWMAIGDASIAFDPLAAVGITKALDEGINAGRLINNANWSPDEYSSIQNSKFKTFLMQRKYHYCLEKRWPKSTFWRRRHV